MSGGRVTIRDLVAEVVVLHERTKELALNQNEIISLLRQHHAAIQDLHERIGHHLLAQILEDHHA